MWSIAPDCARVPSFSRYRSEPLRSDAPLESLGSHRAWSLDLDPGHGPLTRHIWRIEPLGDDTLQPQGAGLLIQPRTAPRNVPDQQQRRAAEAQQTGEHCFAVGERKCPHVQPTMHQHVEGAVDDWIDALAKPPPLGSVLQAVEAGAAEIVEHADLAVQHRPPFAERAQGRIEFRKP